MQISHLETPHILGGLQSNQKWGGGGGENHISEANERFVLVEFIRAELML